MDVDEIQEFIRCLDQDREYRWSIPYSNTFIPIYSSNFNRGKVAEWLREGLQNL